MLAKLTSKNQLTLPKAVTREFGAAEYWEVEALDGRIVLTPVRIQRGDAVRAKLAELKLVETDLVDAVAWARSQAATPPSRSARGDALQGGSHPAAAPAPAKPIRRRSR